VITDRPLELRRVRVAAIRTEAIDVRSYDLSSADGRPLPPFTAGSHVDVHLPGSHIRQYSLCGDLAAIGGYRIAVKLERSGRGGSRTLHEDVEVGDVLSISPPRNHFPLASEPHAAILIAGGIGITPLYAMAHELHARRADWTLHYCARSAAHAAFHEELSRLDDARVEPHFSEVPVLDTAAMLREQPVDAHVYCCGPAALMTAVASATTHWSEGSVHFEWFTAPDAPHAPNVAFEVELARSGLVLAVPPDRSILQVVREAGVDVPSACEQGLCGTCETRVIAGEPDHRDVLLSDAERAAGETMMVCSSRAKSSRLVLDL
jgi:ferredoxin-NADP reductase